MTQCSVDAFIVSALPRTAEIDSDRLHADLFQPYCSVSAVNSLPLSERMKAGFPRFQVMGEKFVREFEALAMTADAASVDVSPGQKLLKKIFD